MNFDPKVARDEMINHSVTAAPFTHMKGMFLIRLRLALGKSLNALPKPARVANSEPFWACDTLFSASSLAAEKKEFKHSNVRLQYTIVLITTTKTIIIHVSMY